MIYFAHRGANTYAVQNTVRAFEIAQAQGATHYELDVHLLRDGQLAVHHDYSLLSTAGVDVLLKDLTSEDLHQYPLKNPFSDETVYVPLLKDVLPVLSPNLSLLNIEIKNDENTYPGIEKILLDFLKDFAHLEILFSSFDFDTLLRLRQLNQTARIGLLTRAFDIQKTLALRAESVHINATRVTPQIVNACHENHLKVYCYTVNDFAQAAMLNQQGVDGIFTDKIDSFLK